MKRIYLGGKRGKGKYTLVDDDVYYDIMEKDLSVTDDSKGYPCISENRSNTLLHKYIIKNGLSPEKDIDHINNNTLDNRRENLRPCSRKENIYNRRGMSNSKYSKFKGVRDSNKTKYRANIRVNKDGKIIEKYSKPVSNEIDAAIAYNKMAIELQGEYARINTVPVPGTIGVKEAEQKYGKYIGDDKNV